MRLFLAFLIAFTHSFGFASTETIIKADVIEGIQTEKNYFGIGGHFEKNANGWSGYDDAAATPADGTGGGTVTTTCTRSTSSPLSGTGSFLYTPAALGEGCSYDITIDSKDKGKVLRLSLEYAVVSGTYTDDDTQIWIYDKTNLSIIQPAPYKLKNHSLASESFAVEFQTATSSSSYRILIHQATSGTAVLKFDNLQIGQQAKLYGSPITDWVSYTGSLTYAGTTATNITSQSYKQSRNGDKLTVTGYVSFNGAANANGAFRIPLPSGMTIDTAKLPFNYVIVGHASAYLNTNKYYNGHVRVDNNNTSYVVIHRWDDSGATDADWAGNTTAGSNVPGGVALTASDGMSFTFTVPISGWSSSVVMSSDSPNTPVAFHASRNGSDQTGFNPNSSFVKVLINSVSGTFDRSNAGYDTTNSKFVAQTPGDYYFSANVGILSTNILADRYLISIYKNGVEAMRGQDMIAVAGKNLTLTVSGVLGAIAGDYFEVYIYGAGNNSASTLTISGGAAVSSFSGTRIASPAQIAASETVAALYTGAPPTGTLNSTPNTATFGTKVKDSHGSYSSGSYTISTSGQFDIGASVDITHASMAINQYVGLGIYVDGVQKYVRYTWCPSASVTELIAIIDVKAVPLLAGQVVTIRPFSTGTTPAYAANATTNNFYITRTGNF